MSNYSIFSLVAVWGCFYLICFFLCLRRQKEVISAEAFPSAVSCRSCCRQAGRQGTLVTARQANRWDLPFPLVCLLSRSLPSYTHTHTTTTHKNKYTPLVPSGEINFTGSHGELWFPGAPHALCRRRRFLHTAWLLTLHHYRGQRTSNPSLQQEGLLPPNTAKVLKRGSFCSPFHFFSRGQMSNVKTCFNCSGSLSN